MLAEQTTRPSARPTRLEIAEIALGIPPNNVYRVWRFETVPDSNLGGLFDHRRANFRQNQSTLGEKSVVLFEESLVTLSQWLNTAFHPRQTRGQDLSSGACAQAAMALDGGYCGFVKRGNCFEEINDRAGVKI